MNALERIVERPGRNNPLNSHSLGQSGLSAVFLGLVNIELMRKEEYQPPDLRVSS